MRYLLLIIVVFYIRFYSFSQNKTDYFIRTIGFYNVENLFDYERDLKIWDADWTPEGKNNWTREKYEDKIEKIARVISEIGNELTQTTPDIIGLAEVENVTVLEDLVNQPPLLLSNYGIIHYNSRDRRGIDVAFLYKKDIFLPTHHQAFPLLLEQENDSLKRFYSRDQLLVKGVLDDEEIHFIVTHWPSRAGGEKFSEPNRIKAANLTRKIVDSIQAQNKTAKIIVMGDFNDTPRNKSIKEILLSTDSKEHIAEEKLFNPFEKIEKQGMGTIAYRDKWALFDQILCSAELVKNDDYTSYRFYKAGIFNKNYLQIRRGKYKGYPSRSFQNSIYTGGYSDHFPVLVYLIREAETE